MKKSIILLLLLFVIITLSWGQSLQDNEYYNKMIELKEQSEAAFEDGDYLEARRLAEESQTYKTLSDEWIETQLAAYRANSALNKVKARIVYADKIKAEENFPEAYAEGVRLYREATRLFKTDKDYVKSLETSQLALEALSDIKYIVPESSRPAYYKVRLLPGNTDCLWNIAGYDFIYGDPWQWKRIYNANRDKFPQKDNPDLILPDMILEIPALNGESRGGTWENGEIK